MGLKRIGRFGTVAAMVAAALGAPVVLNPLPAAAANEWLCHGTSGQRAPRHVSDWP
jgi:hypothetical protein